jgi:chloramphenicol-sensitive protein RarD
VWLAARTEICFGLVDLSTTILLLMAGAATALPLVWFTNAARRLPLTTLGIFQYLAPTLHFFLGVFLYEEPFTWMNGVTFLCIWTGVGLFVGEALLLEGRGGKIPQRVLGK